MLNIPNFRLNKKNLQISKYCLLDLDQFLLPVCYFDLSLNSIRILPMLLHIYVVQHMLEMLLLLRLHLWKNKEILFKTQSKQYYSHNLLCIKKNFPLPLLTGIISGSFSSKSIHSSGTSLYRK